MAAAATASQADPAWCGTCTACTIAPSQRHTASRRVRPVAVAQVRPWRGASLADRASGSLGAGVRACTMQAQAASCTARQR